eukprot:12666366-Alexandrium_andersonii.AAC.1
MCIRDRHVANAAAHPKSQPAVLHPLVALPAAIAREGVKVPIRHINSHIGHPWNELDDSVATALLEDKLLGTPSGMSGSATHDHQPPTPGSFRRRSPQAYGMARNTLTGSRAQ